MQTGMTLQSAAYDLADQNMKALIQADIDRTISVFPALAKESTKLKVVLETGMEPHQHKGGTPSVGKRRLRQHLPHHSLRLKQPKGLATPQQEQRDCYGPVPSRESRPESLLGVYSMTESSGRSLRTTGSGTGWSKGSEGLSTTSKKMIEFLSTSVYDELEPFRLAHRTLIKNRMAVKTAHRDVLRKQSGRSACASSDRSKRRRKKSPLETGLSKITLCASSFGWVHGKRDIKGFQRLRMLPVEFREQLQMSLHIYLRLAEATAVTGFFDLDDVGSVNGEHFVRWFLRAGNMSREKHLKAQALQQQEEKRLQGEEERVRESRRYAANLASVGVEFSESDKAEALAVLGRVALSYHDQRTGHEAAQRDFSCALAPDEFREQLYRSFGVRLTDQQFAALFDTMDLNRDQRINGAEFLRFFFGLGNEERAKEQRQHQVNCSARARSLKQDKLPPIAPILGR